MSNLIAINGMVVVTGNDVPGEPNTINVELKTVVLKRPTSLQSATGSHASMDVSRVSHILCASTAIVDFGGGGPTDMKLENVLKTLK